MTPQSDASPPAEPASKRNAALWPVLVVGLLSALAVWRYFAAGPQPGDDWGQYLSHARALLEGRPYADIGYLFSPLAWTVGPPTYPPGLPVTLLPFVAALPESIATMRVLMYGLLAAFLASSFHYFSRDGESTVAWGMVALLGTSFLLLGTPNSIGSDLGMCAFTWAAVATVRERSRWSVSRGAVVGVLGLLAISYRLAAVPLVPAMFFWALLRRRTAGWVPWAVGAAWATAFVTVFVLFGSAPDVIGSVGADTIDADQRGPLALMGWVFERLDGKLNRYRFALSEVYLYPFPIKAANQLYHVVALALTAVGLWIWTRRDWSRFGIIVAASTSAMLLIIPVWDQRYALVLLPFVCFGLVRGAAAAIERGSGSSKGAANWATSIAVCVSAFAVANDVRRPDSPELPTDQEWRDFGEALQATDFQGTIRAASNRPRVLAWLTRIPAAGLSPTDIDPFLDEAVRLGVTHIVLTRRAPEANILERFDAWDLSRPGLFQPVAKVGMLEGYRINMELR
ncbi:MAG: hypothetical protein ACI9OJ_004287 [Myxococcota bacterium]